jgi:hypothetical protein
MVDWRNYPALCGYPEYFSEGLLGIVSSRAATLATRFFVRSTLPAPVKTSKIVVWPQFNVDNSGRACVGRPTAESSSPNTRNLLASTAPEFQPFNGNTGSARPWLNNELKGSTVGA